MIDNKTILYTDNVVQLLRSWIKKLLVLNPISTEPKRVNTWCECNWLYISHFDQYFVCYNYSIKHTDYYFALSKAVVKYVSNSGKKVSQPWKMVFRKTTFRGRLS